MPPHTLRHPTLAAAFAATMALAACGGQSSSPAPAPVPAPAPAPRAAPATTLTLSLAQLAMAASGNTRTVTITNTGLHPALDLATQATGLPAGTSVSASTCTASLPPGSTCSLTLTPGPLPTAAPGDLAPTAALLDVAGSNTNTLSLNVSVITYGSVYQGGYVFDIDDTTPASGGIGGKVAALSDISSAISWSASPSNIVASQSLTDGASNTVAIVLDQGAGVYAAQACTQTINGHSDWYLPSICELGYEGGGGVCGSSAAPLLPGNMQSRLKNNGLGGIGTLWYWSSTESATNTAHLHFFNLGGSIQNISNKLNLFPARCARAHALSAPHTSAVTPACRRCKR